MDVFKIVKWRNCFRKCKLSCKATPYCPPPCNGSEHDVLGACGPISGINKDWWHNVMNKVTCLSILCTFKSRHAWIPFPLRSKTH